MTLLRLSQGHLTLLETCPRKFQHTVLEQLGTPASPAQQERLDWGSQFHLLMQQQELGLRIASLLAEDEQMGSSLESLVRATGTPSPTPEWREAEHCRTFPLGAFLFTVVYDLLISRPEQAEILDWKTYPQPKDRKSLQNHWQTRLYLFVLAETSDYVPEQLSMTYWFVKLNTKPECCTLPYSTQQHEQTRQDLTRLLKNLETYYKAYQNSQEFFPQIPEDSPICQGCPFAYRCHRDSQSLQALNRQEMVTTLEQIPEIPIE